ncbi:hypothetical protein QR685DRAFT_237671 [Neurospora intermedia]|uniref:Ecp2 effector protein-like domain-containing protein n=1 Tax=Neurospora intermedia TaxID=5142 RepID=A0ABR3DJF6_NEUIN
MRTPVDLTATALKSGAVISKDAVTTAEAATVTAVETESYIDGTITNADSTSYTVLVYFVLKRSIGHYGTCPDPNKSRRLGYSYRTLDMCDDTSLIDKTSGASSTVGNCAEVHDCYRRDNDYFSASVIEAGCDPWCRLVITRSCVFGIEAKNGQGTEVGNSDIADLVNPPPINTYQLSSKIGAEGITTCASRGGQDPVGYFLPPKCAFSVRA